MLLSILDVLLGSLALYLAYTAFFAKRPPLPLPPGPKPLPLLGNLLDLPKGFEAAHWATHEALYGPISSVSVFRDTIVILNDSQIAVDLLEKRSSIYSSRPRLVFAGEMCAFGPTVTLLPYGEAFRNGRKMMHSYIGNSASLKGFEELEELEARRFLVRMMKNPKERTAHIRKYTGAIILKLSYGYTIEAEKPDPLVELVDGALDNFSRAGAPGAWAVDIMPFLRNLPDWFPGTGFKETARQWSAVTEEFLNKPYAFTRSEVLAGKASPSFAQSLIDQGHEGDADFECKWAVATVYGGGADTTVSALSTFFLAMTISPSVVKRAQDEIFSVVGDDRLPTFSDRPHLPYVDAILKETLRWNNVVPLGVPHVTSEDDEYKGYFIPKGSIVIANIWKFTHDPATYHDPTQYKPERFLGVDGRSPEPDSRNFAFGFGRRICPGRELADNSLFIAIAMILAVFNISKVKDSAGREIEPVQEYSGGGLISHPKEFECSVTPRSAKATSLISTVLEEHPFEASDAGKLVNLKWKAS